MSGAEGGDVWVEVPMIESRERARDTLTAWPKERGTFRPVFDEGDVDADAVLRALAFAAAWTWWLENRAAYRRGDGACLPGSRWDATLLRRIEPPRESDGERKEEPA